MAENRSYLETGKDGLFSIKEKVRLQHSFNRGHWFANASERNP